MKALVLNGVYAPKLGIDLSKNTAASKLWQYPTLSFTTIREPELEADEVLVEVAVCGICGSDLHCLETDSDGYLLFSGPASLPVVLGHEFTGQVVEIGSNVSNIHLNQIVAAESIQACFNCQNCRDGHLNQCENIELVGLTINGAMTQYVKIKAAHCYPIDLILEQFGADYGCEVGTLLEPLGCAYNALYINGPGIGPSDRLAVFGAGPIGLSFIALARAADASLIIAFDLIDERLKLAKTLGADLTYNSHLLAASGSTPDGVIAQATKGEGLTIVVEAAGAVEVFSPGLRGLKAKGTFIYVGRTAPAILFDSNQLVSNALRIVGSRGHAGYDIYPTLIKMMARKQINMTPFITSRYRFDDVIGAMEEARYRSGGKVVVRVIN